VFTGKNTDYVNKLRIIFDSSKTRFASSITLYEVYKLTLAHDGKAVADLRTSTIEKQFTIVDVSPEIAKEGAKISHRLKVPMADSLIMATAKQLRVPCVTDDPHFTEVRKVWV
jgi:predicted nucleic acid-binding protein